MVSMPGQRICPLTGDSCYTHGCEFYMPVAGTDPNTGEPVRPFECAFKLVPVFLMGTISAIGKMDAEISAARSDLRQSASALGAFFNELNGRINHDKQDERHVTKVHLPRSE